MYLETVVFVVCLDIRLHCQLQIRSRVDINLNLSMKAYMQREIGSYGLINKTLDNSFTFPFLWWLINVGALTKEIIQIEVHELRPACSALIDETRG